MNSNATAIKDAALQRCLNSPYLSQDESQRARASEDLAAARTFYDAAVTSFTESDEATGLKQVWGSMFRAARSLARKAGYRVDQLRCLEVVLRVHYPTGITEADIADLRRAQELLGPPDVALRRAKSFLEKVSTLA